MILDYDYILKINILLKLLKHLQPSLKPKIFGGNRVRYNKSNIIEKYIDQMKQIN